MKTANRSTIGVIAAVLLALVGGLLLWRSAGDADSGATEAAVDEVPVLVATAPIDRSVPAEELAETAYAYVEVTTTPADQVAPNALSSVDELAALGLSGNVTVSAIAIGDQITLDHFIVPGDQVSTGLDPAENLFTMTVLLDTRRALAGAIDQGDIVAIVGSFEPAGDEPGQTVIVLDQIKVIDIRAEVLPADTQTNALNATVATNTNHWVTFELTADELERLSYATEFGRISLAGQGKSATVIDSQIRERDNVVVPLDERTGVRTADADSEDD